MSTKPNEIPLGSLGGLIPGGGADHQAVETHLAVQGAIRYHYWISRHCSMILVSYKIFLMCFFKANTTVNCVLCNDMLLKVAPVMCTRCPTKNGE